MSCCGGNCGCGSGCRCGKRSFDETAFDAPMEVEVTVFGNEGSNCGFDSSCGFESDAQATSQNGCSCGSNCTCNPCRC
uniref:Metallothionein-like protein n=1 Tax=Azolla filiculoides TaxID=84609 RepID=Q8S3M2_AZOFI|nr:metallothionein-like protein 2 [Azolla filiculoides]